jgi:hypothetical protein
MNGNWVAKFKGPTGHDLQAKLSVDGEAGVWQLQLSLASNPCLGLSGAARRTRCEVVATIRFKPGAFSVSTAVVCSPSDRRCPRLSAPGR